MKITTEGVLSAAERFFKEPTPQVDKTRRGNTPNKDMLSVENILREKVYKITDKLNNFQKEINILQMKRSALMEINPNTDKKEIINYLSNIKYENKALFEDLINTLKNSNKPIADIINNAVTEINTNMEKLTQNVLEQQTALENLFSIAAFNTNQDVYKVIKNNAQNIEVYKNLNTEIVNKLTE